MYYYYPLIISIESGNITHCSGAGTAYPSEAPEITPGF